MNLEEECRKIEPELRSKLSEDLMENITFLIDLIKNQGKLAKQALNDKSFFKKNEDICEQLWYKNYITIKLLYENTSKAYSLGLITKKELSYVEEKYSISKWSVEHTNALLNKNFPL